MRRLILTAAGLVPLATSVPAAAAGLAEAGELEAARANARAGGPVSERDAELLERVGMPERDAQCVLRAPFAPGRPLLSAASARAPAPVLNDGCTAIYVWRNWRVPMAWWWAV